MQLQEFIKQVLVQIAEGVKEADQELGAGYVNPEPRGDTKLNKVAEAGYIPSDKGTLIQQVQFDVAVSSAEGKETKGGIGLMIAPLALGSQGKSDSSSSSTSRISFKVPLALHHSDENR